jgi:hypothetical protein
MSWLFRISRITAEQIQEAARYHHPNLRLYHHATPIDFLHRPTVTE